MAPAVIESDSDSDTALTTRTNKKPKYEHSNSEDELPLRSRLPKKQLKRKENSDIDINSDTNSDTDTISVKDKSNTEKKKRKLMSKVKIEENFNSNSNPNSNSNSNLNSDSDVPIASKKVKKNSNSTNSKNGTTSNNIKNSRNVTSKTNGTKSKNIKNDTKIKKEDTSSFNIKKEKTISKKVKKETTTSTKVKNETPPLKKRISRIKSETPIEKEGSEGLDDKEPNDEEKEEYKWWEEEQNDGTIKWTTLEHNGVIFPPPYEPLPNDIKLYYDGKPVDLPPQAEEVAGFFGAMLESDHAKNPTFQKNFFKDFKQVLNEYGGTSVEITDFDKLDFTQMFEYFEKKRIEKKNLTSAQKKAIKAERDKQEEKYKFCILDGHKETVGNFKIEPPGLFRGRGAHPKTGKLKYRVYPEQVTLNIGKEAKVPDPPEGHKWGEIRHDSTVSWLATWKENISNSVKYVRLAANSSLKGISDFRKFEKARELKNHIQRIRKDYELELKDELMAKRQRATAMYLIDRLALRAGGEKGEDEADTVGCCSLRYEHVTLKPPNIVIFDFLGKDSIRFHQEVPVEKQVFKNLRIFKKSPKKVGDDIFDRLDPPTLNKHLQNYMPGLTAKVFRTYNASITMEAQLAKIPNVGNANEKLVAYNAANREVAILCNHQRTVSKTHSAAVEKMEDRIREVKLQRWQLILLLEQGPDGKKIRKRHPELFIKDPELSDEAVLDLHEKCLAREEDKIRRKFKKDNEKIEEEALASGEEAKHLPESVLEERLAVIDEMRERFKKERANGLKPLDKKNELSSEKIEGQIAKLDERIINYGLSLKDKEDNSSVALSTSKINYIDPRLTVMFSKKYDVPMEKLFSKTLREKFKWAIESAGADWKF